MVDRAHYLSDHHEHSHDHILSPATVHAPADFAQAFAIGIVLNLGFVAIETVYGFLAQSLSLLAVSGHLLSVAVVFAGLLILWTGQQWVDPVMSLAVAVVILWGSIGLLKESVWMSLAGVPSGIDVDLVEAELAELEGVETVHDLHIWPLST